MRTISQRQMRNDSSEVLREVEHGQQYTVTRRGTPVARIVPYQDSPLGLRPARRPAVFAAADLIRSAVSSEQVVSELRDGER